MPKAKQNGSLSAFVRGLASFIEVGVHSKPLQYPHKSTASALRGDMVRIGVDMKNVIDREYESTQKKATQG